MTLQRIVDAYVVASLASVISAVDEQRNKVDLHKLVPVRPEQSHQSMSA